MPRLQTAIFQTVITVASGHYIIESTRQSTSFMDSPFSDWLLMTAVHVKNVFFVCKTAKWTTFVSLGVFHICNSSLLIAVYLVLHLEKLSFSFLSKIEECEFLRTAATVFEVLFPNWNFHLYTIHTKLVLGSHFSFWRIYSKLKILTRTRSNLHCSTISVSISPKDILHF